MLVNKLKLIAEASGWKFNYGDYDWQNLQDFFDDTDLKNDGSLPETFPARIAYNVYFLLLWKSRQKEFDRFNNLVAEIFTGEFILSKRSDFTEKDYNYKYDSHISKIEAMLDEMTIKINDCENLYIKSWIEDEVSNALDTNIDGIKVKFTIRHEI